MLRSSFCGLYLHLLCLSLCLGGVGDRRWGLLIIPDLCSRNETQERAEELTRPGGTARSLISMMVVGLRVLVGASRGRHGARSGTERGLSLLSRRSPAASAEHPRRGGGLEDILEICKNLLHT